MLHLFIYLGGGGLIHLNQHITSTAFVIILDFYLPKQILMFCHRRWAKMKHAELFQSFFSLS